MNVRKLTRRHFLSLSAAGAVGASVIAACGATPTPQVIEKVVTSVVEKEVTKIVAGTPQVVKETVIVPATPQVVEETVVVTQVSRPPEVVWTSWATDTFGMFRVEEQAAQFRQKYPDIVVQIRNVASSSYRERLLTTLAAGAGPDVYRLCTDSELAFYKDGQCEQLDPWFEKQKDSWFWTDDVNKTIVDAHRIKDKLWFYPMALDVQAFCINKTLFEQAGLPLPPMSYKSADYKSVWTYEKYLDTVKALTKFAADGTPQQFGTTVYPDYYYLHDIITSKTGRFWMSDDGSQFLGADPAVTEAIQWYADIRLVHKAAPTPEQSKGGAFDYSAGRLALDWQFATWLCYGEKNVGDRFDWDIAPLPHWGDGNPGLFPEPCVWVFNPHSKVKDATWTFFHWLVGPEGVRVPTELAWEIPIYKSVEPYFGKRIPTGKNLSLGPEGVSIASSNYFWLKNLNFFEAWSSVMEPALEEVLLGSKTAQEAMTAIKPQMDKVLQEGKAAMT